MIQAVGFFEVCCRERALSGVGTSFAERAAPFSDKLEGLQSLARQIGGPFVFTICCADRFICEGGSPETLIVPRNPRDAVWVSRVPSHRVFNIEKKAECGDIAQDDADRIFDMFLHNHNAAILFGELNVPRWVVYGVGIDLCVSSAAKGLLGAGRDVTVLSDVLVSNAEGTPETMAQMLSQLRQLGARTQTYEELRRDLAV